MSGTTPGQPSTSASSTISNPADSHVSSPASSASGAASTGGRHTGPVAARRGSYLDGAEGRSTVHPQSPVLDLTVMHRLPVNWLPRMPLPDRAPSPWGIRNREGFAIRWLVDEDTRACGFALIPPAPAGPPVFLETTSPHANPSYAMPDPFRHATWVSDAFARLVRRTGRIPRGERLASQRRGGVPVRLQGWHAVQNLHQVLLTLPADTSDATVHTTLAWAEFDPPLAQQWQKAGCTTPWCALKFAEVGIPAADGAAWTGMDLPPEEVAHFIANGWSAQQGRRLHRFEPFDTLNIRARPLRLAWASSGLPARTVLACLAAGVSLAEHRTHPMPVSTLRALAALRQGHQP